MATREDIYAAIRNADAAGDTEAVQKLGAYLKTLPAPAPVQAPPIAGGMDPTSGMSGPELFAAGIGKSMTDIGRGIGQFTGLVNRDDVAQARQRDAALMATGAGKAGDITGSVALTAPLALIPGAATIPGGIAIGALTGLAQPSTSTGETLSNAGLGAVAGGAVPALVRGLRVAKAAAEPFYDAGQKAIVGRALNAAAGSDAAAVAKRLQDAGTPFVGPSLPGAQRTTMGELVPGSLPTVGQAAQNPGVAALERAATASNPSVTNAVSGVMGAQNAARVSALEDLAGKGGARDFFAANRDATAEQLYDSARRLGVDPTNLTPDVLQNIANFSQRIPDSVLAKARELAKIKGETMTDATSVQGLHWVKKGIDSLIGQAQRAGDNTTAAALTGLQHDLLSGMDNLSPAYAAARKTYAAMSRPVNQMDVAQAIADKSINRLSGNIQPNAYANALTDQTAARATGFPGATLENTMDPAQVNVLNAILADLQRANAAQNVGRGVGSDTVQKLAYSNLLDQSGIPTFLRELKPAQVLGNLAGRASDAAYARANRELSNRLAEIMLDPGSAGQLMLRAVPRQSRANALLPYFSALSLGAPPTANALQQ